MSQGTEDLTRQHRKLLAQLTEYMPLGDVPKVVLQEFINGRASAASWLTEQMRCYTNVLHMRKSYIDCGGIPHIPDGWSICPEDQLLLRFTGVISWDKNAHGGGLQKKEERAALIKFENGFRGAQVLPAQMLDWLLCNTDEIPEEWHGQNIWFPGTVYRTEKGQRAVRHLCEYQGGWSWNFRCIIDDNYQTFLPAAKMPPLI